MRKWLSYLILAVAFTFSFNVFAVTIDTGSYAYSENSTAFNAPEKVPVTTASSKFYFGKSFGLNKETTCEMIRTENDNLDTVAYIANPKSKYEVGWRM